ncbi:ABC transporter substrate-binding protein [Streptomyces sp. NPDC058964]|uniref:ABC transporter substrate-binding protein n=1 Tax=Streptomyces sp. NPDC058964 TaxID=3346681 RepID=UPI0036C7D6CA
MRLHGTKTAVLCVIALAAAACSGGASGSSAGSQSAYVRDGTFTSTLSQDPGKLDPYHTVVAAANDLLSFAYDPLVTLDDKGNPIPGLTTNWDVTPSSVTLTLRKGVTCSDGSAVTPTVVSKDLDYLKDPKAASPLLGIVLPSPDFTTRADDAAGTITITTGKPDGLLLQSLAAFFVVCGHGTADPTTLARTSSGSGPYKLTEAAPNDHYTLVRRDEYAWGPNGARINVPGAPQKIVLKIVNNDTTAANLLTSGSLNGSVVNGPDRERLVRTMKEHRFEDGGTLAVFNEHPGHPGADPVVRKALTQALDRGQIADVLTDRQGKIGNTTMGVPPLICDDSGAAAGIPAFDAAAAAAALDTAGWRKGADGIRAKGGKRLSLTAMYSSDRSNASAGMELFSAAWKKLGVDVQVKSLNSAAFLQAVFQSDNWDVTPEINLATQLPSQSVSFFSGPGSPKGSNFAGIHNTAYEQLVAQAVQIPGRPGCQMWTEAEKALFARADVVPIAQRYVSYFGRGATFEMSGEMPLPTSIRLHAD